MSQEMNDNSHKSEALRSVPFAITRYSVTAIWYFCWFAAIMLVFAVVVMLSGKADTISRNFRVPLKVEYQQDEIRANQDLDSSKQTPTLTEVKGTAKVKVAQNNKNNILFLLRAGVLWAMIMWAIYQLRLILKSINAGEPFNPLNPRRIRWIAWMVILASQYSELSQYFGGTSIIDNLSISGAKLSLAPDYNLDILFLGLLIFVLAQVFEIAGKLQREQDLTI